MKPDQLPSLLVAKSLPPGSIFVEIGTWEGGFSNVLLSETKCEKLHCVDPYKHFTNNEYLDGMNTLLQHDFDKKYTDTNLFLKKYGQLLIL